MTDERKKEIENLTVDLLKECENDSIRRTVQELKERLLSHYPNSWSVRKTIEKVCNEYLQENEKQARGGA